MGTLWVAEPWPEGLGPHGIVTGLADGLAPDDPLDWRDVRDFRDVQVDSAVLTLHGRVILRTASRARAHDLAKLLQDLADLPAAERQGRLDRELDRRWDLPAVRESHARVQRQTRPLRMAETCLFLGVFVLLPVLLLTPAVELWRVLLPLLAGLWLATLAVYEWTVRRSGLPKPVWSQRLTVLLSPMAALRSHDLWTLEALANHEPLALVAAILPRDQARPLLAQGLAHWMWPVSRRLPDDAKEQGEAWRAQQIRRLEAVIRAAGLDPITMRAPPDPEDAASVHWCPRCRSQFGGQAVGCPTCPGVPLQGFARGQC